MPHSRFDHHANETMCCVDRRNIAPMCGLTPDTRLLAPDTWTPDA